MLPEAAQMSERESALDEKREGDEQHRDGVSRVVPEIEPEYAEREAGSDVGDGGEDAGDYFPLSIGPPAACHPLQPPAMDQTLV